MINREVTKSPPITISLLNTVSYAVNTGGFGTRRTGVRIAASSVEKETTIRLYMGKRMIRDQIMITAENK
jgi:hypothetical protein